MSTLLNTPRAIVLPYAPGDSDRMAPHLRDADLLELRSVAGDYATFALLDNCVKQSQMTWSIFAKKNHEYPAAIFGVAQSPIEPGTGFPWLLGTKLIEKEIARDFLRFGREWLKVLHSDHAVLTNIVHARNRLHIRWLSWLGVSFIKVHRPGTIPTLADPSQTFLEFVHTYECNTAGSPP